MNINNPAHPHHKVWREHVQSVLDDPENPKVVQYLQSGFWVDHFMNINGIASTDWDEHFQYRIKPHTVTRTLTYPKPLSEAPAISTKYWTLVVIREPCVEAFYWHDCHSDRRILSRGICFATEADALAAAKAIFGGGV